MKQEKIPGGKKKESYVGRKRQKMTGREAWQCCLSKKEKMKKRSCFSRSPQKSLSHDVKERRSLNKNVLRSERKVRRQELLSLSLQSLLSILYATLPKQQNKELWHRKRDSRWISVSQVHVSQVKTRLSLWLSFLPDPNSYAPEDDISSSSQCLAISWIEHLLFLLLLPVSLPSLESIAWFLSLSPSLSLLLPLLLLTKSSWSSVCFTQLFFFSLNALSFPCFI